MLLTLCLWRISTPTHRLGLGFLHNTASSVSLHRTRCVQLCLYHHQRGHIAYTVGNAGPLTRDVWSKSPAVFQVQQLAKYCSINNCKKEYTILYHFPGMRYLRVISRFKLAQTFFTVGIAPPMWYFHSTGLITDYQLWYSLSVATFALMMLYTMSFFLRRIIGFIYLPSNNRDSIRIAHMDFWGKRRDQTIPLCDVIPIGETGEKTSEILIRLKRYSTKEKLYFSLKYGVITDPKTFCEIFGDVISLTNK